MYLCMCPKLKDSSLEYSKNIYCVLYVKWCAHVDIFLPGVKHNGGTIFPQHCWIVNTFQKITHIKKAKNMKIEVGISEVLGS